MAGNNKNSSNNNKKKKKPVTVKRLIDKLDIKIGKTTIRKRKKKFEDIK